MKSAKSFKSAVLIALAGTSLALGLAGCAQPWQKFTAGEDVSVLTASMGPPPEQYPLANGTRRLLWPTRPFGEVTTAAVVDASGKVLDVRQVLSNEEFARAEIGRWTKQDVLENFGLPEETAYFPLMKRQVWTYRYKDSGVWYMLYSFYFDPNGILTTTQKTPDPLHDPTERALF
ncbi:MAG: hypothetical protein ACRYG5_10255 [Janthinobacterium lividum]